MKRKIIDWTDDLIKVIEKENLRGFVFKSGSSSCALHDAIIYDDKTGEETFFFGSGLFAEAVMTHFPNITAKDENGLSESSDKIEFSRRVKKSGERR